MPLLWLSLAFLVGIILAAQITLPTATWLTLAAAAFLVNILYLLFRRYTILSRLTLFISRFTSRLYPIPYSLIPLFLFLGAARFQYTQPNLEDPRFIAWYNQIQGSVVIEGVLTEPPDVRDTYTNLRVDVNQVRLKANLGFTKVHGLLLARVPPDGEWHYGDLVHLEGQLQTPPENEDFSYRDYLAREGIYSYMQRASAQLLLHNQGSPVLSILYAIKERALATIYHIYPDPEASLLAGILLGIESGIPQRVTDAFKATGTSHIIAISGFNISIIAGLFATGFGRLLGPKRGAVISILGIAAYTILVGADASVVRAAIMGSLSLIARQLGRRQTALNTLAFTAAVMALLNPQTLWDVGFQLSFGATLGLVLYADPFAKGFTDLLARRLPRSAVQRIAAPVGEYFLFTLAAQVMTLPIMAYYFKRISLVSLITNPVVLPVQPPLMIFGGLAVILGILWQPLGQLIAYLTWPLIAFTIRAIELFAQIPGGTLTLGRMALPTVILIYTAILALTVAGFRFREKLLALSPAVPLGILGLLAIFTWRSAFSAPDGRLHVLVMDVGRGDGLLIQTPTGRNLLIDGGPSATRLSDALGRRLSLSSRGLDWLVVAAPSDEQVLALSQVLDRFRPADVLWAGPTHGTRGARDLQAKFVLYGIPQTLALAGQTLNLGDGATLKALTVGKRGAILLLEWERFRMLFPLGANFDDLETLKTGKAIGPVTALLLADGGYAPLNPPEWIDNLHPQIVLISVSPADRQELPSPETLTALQGYTVLRTDRNGWIELSTNGSQMQVEVERR